MNKQCYVYLVEGRVQGVGYRKFTFDTARQLKISGWVKNLPTGKVECLAIGKNSTLSLFETFLRRGSPLSSVSNVQVKEIFDSSVEKQQAKSSCIFEIRY